jgi:succinate dehydrogenase / fumarate reductase, cytochrome b subunit
MSKLARVTLPQALAYRGGQPMFAWLLHRISALGIVIFVGMHLTMAFLVYATTESVTNDVANWLTTVYALAPVQIFVLFCVLYHATNGLRIVILDMWPALHRFNKEAMWVQWALFVPMFLLPAALIAMGVTIK